MHIAFLFDYAPQGNANARFVGLLEAVHHAGHRASLVVGAGTPSDEVQSLIKGRLLVVPTHADMSASAALEAAADVVRLCEDESVDVQHAFSGVSMLVSALAAARLKQPYVVSLDAPVGAAAASQTLALLFEHALSGASRVFCSSREIARIVLGTTPDAQCRPFPNEADVEQNGRGETWGAYLTEVVPTARQPASVDVLPRLRAIFERFPQLSICSADIIRELVRSTQEEAAAAVERLAELNQTRSYELHQHEQARTRQRERLEAIDKQIADRMSELATARAQVEKLSADLAERDHRLLVSSVQAAERERELTEIKSSTGWAVLILLWRLRSIVVPHGSRRDRSLWIMLCTYRAWRRRGIAGVLAAAIHAAYRSSALVRLLDAAPVAARNWLDDQMTQGGTTQIQSTSVNGAQLLMSWSENPVLTVASRPRSKSHDVIIFSIIDWNFRFQRPQQLASQFAEAGHRVFYVATTFCDGGVPIFRPLRAGIVEIQLPGPTALSTYRDELGDVAHDLVQIMAQIRGQFNIADAVCLVNLPFWTPLVLQLREQFGWRIIYDCLDDYSGFTNTTKRMLRAEETLTRESDLVFVTSRHLLHKQSPLNPNCELLPNASDFQHFRFGSFARPDDLARLRPNHPVIGYYGAIADWFDSALVGALARARPDWEFLLIGSTFGCDLRPIRNQSNVHLLGEKPYNDLPPYLHAFDVGIIPFKKLPLTEATNPVKLFEYASAGKRIVATDLSELRNYADYVSLATDVPSWLTALDHALGPLDEAETARRVDFGRRNSWAQRRAQVDGLISSLYPIVSIIIVTYNNLDYTRLCLESIFTKTAYPSFEVIVVDNASSDGTDTFLKDFAAIHPDVKVILNETNFGFAKANNIGIEVANGEYIVFLNNDTVVTSNWLSRLIYYLRDDHVGMVGPVTNWSGNESRIEVPYTTIGVMDSFAEDYTRRHAGQTFEIRMLALFCAAIRRSTLDDVGLLDERFGIGMFEDDDYAHRLRERGYSVICSEDVFVHHWGRASFSRLDETYYQRLFEENRQKFEEKWAVKWEPHHARLSI